MRPSDFRQAICHGQNPIWCVCIRPKVRQIDGVDAGDDKGQSRTKARAHKPRRKADAFGFGALIKAPKQKKCDKRKGGCGLPFSPARPMQIMCGYECALGHIAHLSIKKAAKAAQEDRRQTRARLEATKTKAQLARAAQHAINAHVRRRDAGKPCISCGTLTAQVYQAGHYLSVGARPELRFDLDNIHAQCVQCNMHKAGNVAAYRVGLIARIGLDRVQQLEGPHPTRHWTREELMQIKRSALGA